MAQRPTRSVTNPRRPKIEKLTRLTMWGRRWFFRVKGGNGEIVIPLSEPYSSAAARDAGIEAAQYALLNGVLVDAD